MTQALFWALTALAQPVLAAETTIRWCEAPEVEPNDSVEDGRTLVFDAVNCGRFSSARDLEWFGFDQDGDEWLEVRAYGPSFGSSATPVLYLSGPDDLLAYQATGNGPREPWLVGPVSAGRYELLLSDNHQGSSDQHLWKLTLSLVERPFTPTGWEAEPNDTSADAVPLGDGALIAGTIGSASDFDRYRIDLPTDAGEYEVTVRYGSYGSALAARVVLLDADTEEVLESFPSDYVAGLTRLEGLTAANEKFVQVMSEDAQSGAFHWYTIELTTVGGGS